jgi:predicted nicotinamide N-methyase
MVGPRTAEDPSSRISFWWGITSAAIALARHVQSMGDELVGKRAVELGCGLGLAGITAGLMGAKVLFTDYVQDALDFAEKNAGLNGLPVENARFRILDWEGPGDLETFDLVLGSEIVYDYFFHGSLIRVLNGIVAPGGLVLLADRKRLCVSRFVGRLNDAGFLCSETVSQVRVNGFPPQEITVFALRRA